MEKGVHTILGDFPHWDHDWPLGTQTHLFPLFSFFSLVVGHWEPASNFCSLFFLVQCTNELQRPRPFCVCTKASLVPSQEQSSALTSVLAAFILPPRFSNILWANYMLRQIRVLCNMKSKREWQNLSISSLGSVGKWSNELGILICNIDVPKCWWGFFSNLALIWWLRLSLSWRTSTSSPSWFRFCSIVPSVPVVELRQRGGKRARCVTFCVFDMWYTKRQPSAFSKRLSALLCPIDWMH